MCYSLLVSFLVEIASRLEDGMTKNDFHERLNWDNCLECGDCLVNCPYMRLDRESAIAEIKNINRGEPSTVTDRCMSCYACNAFCQQNAHPYERIHYNWNERYRQKGLPARASYLMPSRRPNFRQDLAYSAAERALHERWSCTEPPGPTVLYPGCNLLSIPLLATGAIFEKLPVWGRWDLCCGEMYFRMGLLDPVKRTAETLTEFYRDKPIDEMVFVCPAGYNMFSHVLPEQFGAEFHFRTAYFTDWFMREIEKGSFEIQKQPARGVVMHDSCHARVLGDAFMDRQRTLLSSFGLTIHETEQNRTHGLCCGVAAACSRYSVVDLIRCGMRQLLALDAAPGEEAAVYCAGCYLTLGCMRLVHPFGKRLVHLLEYARQAIGEDVERRNTAKSLALIKGVSTHALPAYLDPRRFTL